MKRPLSKTDIGPRSLLLESVPTSPLVIGHRGTSALAPENTLAAFRRAMQDGADGIEFDVRLSRDGVPVVIHDATLRRTGLRAGNVAEITASELSRVDVGSWFNRAHPGFARDEFSSQHLPSLEEVFQLFTVRRDPFTKAKLYVEIKTESAKSSATELARAVVSSVLAHKLEQRAVVLAFDLHAIVEARSMSSVVRTGALFKPRVSRLAGLVGGRELISKAIRSGANEVALHRALATRGVVASAIEQGLNVVVWTVNNPKWIIRTRNWGVNAVISDNPSGLCTMRV